MQDVITIGTANRDVFLESRDFKLIHHPSFLTNQAQCFELGAKINIEKIYFTTGGGATNSAVAFQRQGLKTACLAVIGDDLGGESILEELQKENIDTRFIIKTKKFRTAYSVILALPSGERTILVYRGAAHHLEKKGIDFKKIKTRWFYISSLSGNTDLLKILVNFAKKNNIKVAYNPGGGEIKKGLKNLSSVLQNLEVMILNQEEAAQLTNLPYKKEKGILKKLSKAGPKIVVMTKGPKGVTVLTDKYLYQAGVLKEKKVADRTGAGDSFGSGFVAGLIKEGNIEYAIQLGSANATSNIEKVGAKEGILQKNDSIYKWGKLKIRKTIL